ncbi:hypothetical protein FDO48_002546 [Enterococcus faecalis]|nr:hypothetical protein [Enterococcus faecalis]EGO8147901.1 hypothetical protein [Enterococcus faecalis]
MFFYYSTLFDSRFKTLQQNPIKQLGATAVFEVNGGIQAVFGGKADLLSQEINQILEIEN